MPDQEKIQQWYNERYRRKGNDSWRPYEAYTLYMDLLRIQPGHTVLDVACGTGFLLRQAVERGANTFGVDIATEAVQLARENSPKSQVQISGGEDLPYPDSFFDRLTCIGALEHFSDLDRGLSEFHRVTKDNAFLCIVVPNSQYFYWKLSRNKGTDQIEIKEKHANLKEWSDLLQSHGYTITEVLQDTWVFRRTPILRPAHPIKIACKLIARLLYRLIPLRYTYQFIFVLEKPRK